jgi:hypothetical protein
VLVADEFVYLHMPKCGGGTVRSVLTTVLPPGHVQKGPNRTGPAPHPHPGWRLIPPEATGRPVFCHVRNPWDYYVSWYCYAMRREVPKRAKLWMSAFGDRPDFPTFLRRACTGKLDHDRPEIAAALRSGQDFYTVRWLDLVGGLEEPQLHVGRFERLFEDLEAFLRGVGAPVPEGFCAKAAAVPRVHLGSRGLYRDYYDDKTRALVERSSSYFLERFGYSFDAAGSRVPLVR